MQAFILTNHDSTEPRDADRIIGAFATREAAQAAAAEDWNTLMEDETTPLEWNAAGTGCWNSWVDDDCAYIVTEIGIQE